MINEYLQDDSLNDFSVFADERFTTKGNREFIDEEDGTFKEW